MPSRRQADVGLGVDMMAACRAEALSKVYGRRDTAVHALREISLSIPAQAFTAIMGPSGSGKSTLLHCLAALDTPTSGRVFLGQTELTSLSRRQQAQVRRDRIGFVFQAFNLVPTLDAIENITLPQLLAGRRPDRDWLEYVVERIGLAERLHHRPSQLSGGQQQRVALARALAGRPEVIFADEPTGNLDTKASREMLALLRSAVDDFRQTVVTVTHDPAIAGYADQVLFFTDGQVVDQVLQPETNLVLEHLQYLDSRTPAHVSPRGQLHASTHSDGQHTMRSRKRRRPDETGPGRPMVGSDDEVEVARQERWLQRIREQFEAEHDANGRHDHAPLQQGVPPASGDEVRNDTNGFHTANGLGNDTTNGFRPGGGTGLHTGNGYGADTRDGRHTGSHDAAPAPRNGHIPNGHHTGETQAVEAIVNHDSGWLPAERSWETDPREPDAAPRDVPPQHADARHAGVDQTWAQPVHGGWSAAADQVWPDQQPVAGGPEPHAPPEPVTDAQLWHTNDLDTDARASRWQPRAGDTGPHDEWRPGERYGVWDDGTQAPEPPPASGSHATPEHGAAEHGAAEQPRASTRRWSWREVRDNQPDDDPWAGPVHSNDAGWTQIDPSQPPADQWAAQSDDWRREPSARPAAPAPPASDEHPAWERWQPQQAGTGQDDAPPANGGRYNGFHAEPATNGVRSEGYADDFAAGGGWHVGDPEPDRGQPVAADQWSRSDASTWQGEGEAHDQAPWQADEPRDDAPTWTHEDQHQDAAPDPEPLDIWSPTFTTDDAWAPEAAPAATPEPRWASAPVSPPEVADAPAHAWRPTAATSGTADETWAPPRAADDADRGDGPDARYGDDTHYADDPHYGDDPRSRFDADHGDDERTRAGADHGDEVPDDTATGAFEHPSPDQHATGGWHVDPAPVAGEPAYPLSEPEPEPAPERYTGTTTDPFEALQSLQSQLDRLGGHSRRPPRRRD